jgi:5-(aminomethyl)-3-furanmethanol phosphate kinase
MIVVKLGGSLLASGQLLPCLTNVERYCQGKRAVIVPGGGVFADQVREAQRHWGFDDQTAHAMAILAMNQMALLFKALNPSLEILESIQDIAQNPGQGRLALWSPQLAELDAAGIPASWAVTSDSLAAWLARHLVAEELILVKSVKIDHACSVLQLAEQRVVDASFPGFTHDAPFKLTIVHAENFLS